MAARVASGPARYTRQTGAVTGRDGASSTPRSNNAGSPSTRGSPHAAKTSRQVRGNGPPATGSGFNIRVKTAPATASAAPSQRSGMRQGPARSPQKASHDQDSPSPNVSASDYRGHGTNPRLAKSRSGKLSSNKPASSPDQKVAASVKNNSISRPNTHDGVSPKQNHQPITAQTAGKKGPAPKASRIPKPTSGKPQFTKNELSDLMAVVDKFSENPVDSSEKSSVRDRSAERERSLDRSPSPAYEERSERGRSRSSDDSDGSETRKLEKETTWRHGDESTGDLGLGGISRREREERAREPRPRKETPADISNLVDQITPSNKRDDRNYKRKPAEIDNEDRGLADLMDLAEGYGATESPKTNARKPAPKTAPKPKLSKSELDQLLNFIDSEELSENRRNSSEEDEAPGNVSSVNTWRTGDGDDEAMNKLRTKPRNRNAPSQPPKWALEDLITDKYATPTSSGRSKEMTGNQVSDSDSDVSESDVRSAGRQKNTGGRIASNDKEHKFSRFDDFMSDTLSSPNTVKDNPTTVSNPVKKQVVKAEHGTPSSKQVVEGPLRASRASDRGCAVPSRTTRSRSRSDERRHGSNAMQHSPEVHRDSGLSFFDEIIPVKESTAQAAPSSSRQKERPSALEKPRRAVGRWEEKGPRGAAQPRFRGSSDKDGDRRNEDRNRKREDKHFANQLPSPKKLQSTGLRSSPVKPAKSRSISPAKSASPAKSRSVTPQKSRSSPSPVKSRSTSPAKSRSTSPKKNSTRNPKSYIDATQKPWPRDNLDSGRWRRSRTPSPPKRSSAVDDDVPRGTSREGRSSYSLRSRATERPPRTPSPSEENPTAKKSTAASHPVTPAGERKPEVIYRNRTEDQTDNRPKRKSLSLAGMSNPDRDDEGQKLRNLIKSTEAMERQMFTLSSQWRYRSDA